MTTLTPALAPVTVASINTRAAAAIAFIFGAVIVIVSGLSGADAVHNATHDTRHAFGLPCH